ncbi:MAG: OsmC family protein [Sedimentisphaerales bacterium]|nr:OsmC family protein [Sedimentisphaerales bacterium]
MHWFKNQLDRQADGNFSTSLGGVGTVAVGAPVEFNGSAETTNPEELLIASLNSCIAMTFMYFARKLELTVDSYSSRAEGEVVKDDGGFRFSQAKVTAAVETSDPDAKQKLAKITELAEKYCLVTRSMSFPIQFVVE